MIEAPSKKHILLRIFKLLERETLFFMLLVDQLFEKHEVVNVDQRTVEEVVVPEKVVA
jgi:hypothetical protein